MVQAAPSTHLSLQSLLWPLNFLSSVYPAPGCPEQSFKTRCHHTSSQPKTLVRPPLPPGMCTCGYRT